MSGRWIFLAYTLHACGDSNVVACTGDDCSCITDSDCTLSGCPPGEVTTASDCDVGCECVSAWVMTARAAEQALTSREETCAVAECADPCLNVACGEYLVLQHARCSGFRCVADAIAY